jgi:hypothetical protein
MYLLQTDGNDSRRYGGCYHSSGSGLMAKQYGKDMPIQQSHTCEVKKCEQQAVIRDTDGNYRCYEHHMEYCQAKKQEMK